MRLVTAAESPDHRNLITLRGTLADGSQMSVSGTLVGLSQRERLVEVNDFVVDLEPTEHLAFFRYEDRPGMVGIVGRILGEAGVNIAGMQVSRNEKGGEALVALSVDSAVPADVLEDIRVAISAESCAASTCPSDARRERGRRRRERGTGPRSVASQLARLGPVAQLRAGRLPRRLAQLALGLVLYGVTLAMMIRSTLGNAPWDVLHQGLSPAPADHASGRP